MQKQNIFLFLLILALFLGGTVEISEGSTALGILLLFLALLTISKIKLGNLDDEVKSDHKMLMLLGLGIVLSDIVFNISSQSRL
ncbi:MAG: archaeosortase C, partial [ANME-2 cluster archaeon]|nr:archaeosortase C [ANME-2 cluster archaeon]